VAFTYHPIGTLATQTDARRNKTGYAYDVLGRITRVW